MQFSSIWRVQRSCSVVDVGRLRFCGVDTIILPKSAVSAVTFLVVGSISSRKIMESRDGDDGSRSLPSCFYSSNDDDVEANNQSVAAADAAFVDDNDSISSPGPLAASRSSSEPNGTFLSNAWAL